METINYIVSNLSVVVNSLLIKSIFITTIFLLIYLYILKEKHKYDFEKINFINNMFYIYIAITTLSYIALFFLILKIHIDTQFIIANKIANSLNSKYFVYSIYFLIFLFFLTIIKILKNDEKKRKRAYKKVLFIKAKKEKIEKITEDNINDNEDFYYYKDNKKIYREDYIFTKLTKINKATKLQKMILKYLQEETKEKEIKEKFLEWEVLRLAEITKEQKKDLVLGQFYSYIKEDKEKELLEAIYNLRAKTVGFSGFIYYKHYIERKKIIERNKNENRTL